VGVGKFTATGDYYTPLTNPVRALDTQHAIGVPTAAKVASGGTVQLKLAGADSVPANAAAVVLNVTETNSVGGGFVTAYPGLTAVPTSSSLNFGPGQTVANTVIVKLGSDGSVDLRNSSTGSIDLIADLEGYYAVAGSSYIASSPVRELDTRASHTTLKPDATVTVNLGLGTSSGTTAATLNITATNATKVPPQDGNLLRMERHDRSFFALAVLYSLALTSQAAVGRAGKYASGNGSTIPRAPDIACPCSSHEVDN
jgi:hypothetical protein